MKKILAFALLVTMVASCGNKQQKDGTETGEFLVDSISYSSDDEKVSVYLEFDMPQETGTPLSDSIRQHISNMLGGSYQGDMNDGKAMIDFYGTTLYNTMREDRSEEEGLAWTSSTSFELDYVTPHYVTFIINTEEFMGGAHGLSTSFYATYHRQSGRTFGYDLLKDTDSDAFHQLLKDGLKSYFSSFSDDGAETSDEELANALLLGDNDDIDHLPLPCLEPGLLKEGISFNYTPYEIAPYMVGSPCFVIPYEKMKPFLTEEGLKWFE